jgi:hypothetical protein
MMGHGTAESGINNRQRSWMFVNFPTSGRLKQQTIINNRHVHQFPFVSLLDMTCVVNYEWSPGSGISGKKIQYAAKDSQHTSVLQLDKCKLKVK